MTQPAPLTDEQHKRAVDLWNTRYPIGTPVTAYPGARPSDDSHCERLITRTRSEAQVLGGHTAVVWVDGHSACIALTHVDPVQSADAYVPPAKYLRSDGVDCCPHAMPVGPGSCEACWDLVKWDAVDAAFAPEVSSASVRPVPAPEAPDGPGSAQTGVGGRVGAATGTDRGER